MNVSDVRGFEIDKSKDMLGLIFDRQRELMNKYHEIEKRNGLLLDENIPVDIHSHRGQYRLKDFAWRVTEELMEGSEANENGNLLHAQEEVSDALHFLTELALISGMGPNDIVSDDIKKDKLEFIVEYHNVEMKYNEVAFWVVYTLGMAMNCLKNKPWKQTQMITDVRMYYHYIQMSYYHMGRVVKACKMNATDLCTIYFKKSEVNKFRQRSNY
jgi:dUTPase